MLSLPLAAALFDALRPKCQLVLVGDVDQLPPVGEWCVGMGGLWVYGEGCFRGCYTVCLCQRAAEQDGVAGAASTRQQAGSAQAGVHSSAADAACTLALPARTQAPARCCRA